MKIHIDPSGFTDINFQEAVIPMTENGYAIYLDNQGGKQVVIRNANVYGEPIYSKYLLMDFLRRNIKTKWVRDSLYWLGCKLVKDQEPKGTAISIQNK